ncbi:4-hydroxy-tetrahydrodipicolinate reductase [Enhygromyxa salina]|uniref:4-hydroxy-tetrahydrodipicolinate reductase n=1 Tax=Enhygromyxa salina TaxID=215803 RepID=A0A2S9YB29_9BACT|nr:4-hydroxy-tetrahydrodipicolinate reductase [Enhygromyxa salina]PRQ02221.1 4-hydroxy-tetrahydrodipicolinate reductase [Enhygromyxa salina]
MKQRMISIIIVGARGRMGTTLIREVMGSDDLTLGACVDRSGGPGIGQDAGRLAGRPDTGVLVTDELKPRRGSVVVDFSLPKATATNVRACVEHGIPLIIGTTGLSEDDDKLLAEAGESIPVVYAANFSVGITLLLQLAGIAAAALGPQWEAELFELHHRFKRDAPSGTALRIGQAVAEASGRKFSEVALTDRSTLGRPRTSEEIGVFGLRGGDSPGEHTLMFLGEGERIELTHRAGDRAIFARGALRAARWAAAQPPGLYDMFDVLGLAE